jgi:hypothetical protein
MFRQQRHGDWRQPIEEIAAALTRRIAERGG